MSVDFAYIARSVVSLEVRGRASELARTDVSVLVIGPDGSGRKHLAEFIHRQSPRHAGPYQALDCDLQIESLWPSRVYGHIAGALPGAATDRAGLLESTAGGTLLLREIDRAPRDLQAHLQHVLEDRSFTRLGEERPLSVGCRVIATAISPDFEACLQVGLRGVLAGAIIRLLPLSQRPEDIPPLIEHFLAVYNARHGKRLRLPDDAELAMMCRLPWAGNVQELESAIDCAVQLAGDEHFSISLLPDHIRGEFNRRTAEVTNVPIESTSSFAAEDICGRLVEQIEELTLRILNGGLLPLPTAPLRCERSALEQPILKEILFGTLRACRKYLVQTAQEVKDLGEKATFRRLGLIDLENPFQQALILALQPAIDDILRAPDGAEFGLYLDVTDIQSHPQSSYRRASASHPEVLQAYDRVENLARSHAGIAPTRDQMVQALRDYIGKHVSAGQVSKVRKELGKAKNRAQKRKRMGFEIAEEQASQVRHHDLVAGCSDPTSESDRAMDAEVLRGEFRAMTGAERAREAKRLQVPLPDEESEQIKVLARAKAIYEHLRDQDPEELREMAQKLHIPTDGMKPAQLIQALQRAVVKADCDV